MIIKDWQSFLSYDKMLFWLAVHAVNNSRVRMDQLPRRVIEHPGRVQNTMSGLEKQGRGASLRPRHACGPSLVPRAHHNQDSTTVCSLFGVCVKARCAGQKQMNECFRADFPPRVAEISRWDVGMLSHIAVFVMQRSGTPQDEIFCSHPLASFLLSFLQRHHSPS